VQKSGLAKEHVCRITIVDRKPFHEAIVEMLQQASNAELETLGALLLRTIIPEGHHDEIVAAWKTRCAEMSWLPENSEYLADALLRHKQDVERQAVKARLPHPRDLFELFGEMHS
jgi:hypothetical protein